jgi:hypothetical protein
MRKPAIQGLVCWAGGFMTLMAFLLLLSGTPTSADGESEAIGRALAHTGVAALIVWLFARTRPNPWTWPRFVATYLATFIVIGLVSTRGVATSERGEPKQWPFVATFPEGWLVEKVAGASSAPQDKDVGIREVAREDGEKGAPVIQLTCVWRHPADGPIDLDALVEATAAKLESQYKSPRTRVENSDLATVKLANYSGRSVTTKVFLDDQLVFEQESLAAATARCLFSAQVAALPSEFTNAANLFGTVIRDITID